MQTGECEPQVATFDSANESSSPSPGGASQRLSDVLSIPRCTSHRLRSPTLTCLMDFRGSPVRSGSSRCLAPQPVLSFEASASERFSLSATLLAACPPACIPAVVPDIQGPAVHTHLPPYSSLPQIPRQLIRSPVQLLITQFRSPAHYRGRPR